MIKRLLFLTFFVAASAQIFAQRPEKVVIPFRNSNTPSLLRSVPLDCNNAGTASLANPSGQSNDFVGPTVYLCFGDRISVVHDGNFDFSEDGIPDNQQGIGYVFYDEFPTITGPTIDSILLDPSLNTTSPIIIGGVPINQEEGIWIARGEQDGNLEVINDGILLAAYNNGIAAPVQFWFAPITLNNFLTNNNDFFGEGGDCVDVDITRAFSIVYLNEIQIDFLSNNNNPTTGCSGEVSVIGGLPEFDNNEFYDITISLQGDPSVQASLNSLLSHGDTVSFNIPQPGVYDVFVEDGKSCGAVGTIDFSSCRAVTFSLPFSNADPGETNVCLGVSVQDFVDIGAVQFSLNWDPAIIQYQTVQNLNLNVPGLNLNSFNEASTNIGQLSFQWPTLGITGTTLTDGETLFEVCFDVIGNLGENSPVSFTDTPTSIQVGDDVGPFDLGYIFNDGQINVSQNAIFLELEADSVVCFGENTGNITVKFGDGVAPYSITYDSIPTFGAPRGPILPPVGVSEQIIPNLYAGDYEVIVTDAGGTTLRDTISIGEPLQFQGRFLVTDAACFGDSIPEIRVDLREDGLPVFNPETKYSFTWDTPWGNNLALNTSILNNVPPGEYGVTVTDANGCFTRLLNSFFVPTEIRVPAPNILVTPATCSGVPNGSVTITPVGGTANGDYLFQWENGFQETGASSTLSGVEPGFYDVTITDNNNCSVVRTFEVDADKVLAVNAAPPTDVSCFGEADGAALVNVQTILGGESLPYTYEWTDSLGNIISTVTSGDRSNTAIDLTAGTYFVTIRDSDAVGCSIRDTVVVGQPDSLIATELTVVDETCINGGGAMDAEASIEVTGGTFPYEYLWRNPELDTVGMDSSLVMLSADTLIARVIDANGCIDSAEVIINAPAPPLISNIQNDMLDCFNDVDGMVSVQVMPTESSIERVDWLDTLGNVLGTGNSLPNLSPGVYYVRALGTNECASLDSAIVSAPSPLFLDSINLIRIPTCPGDADGILNVSAVGGNIPYQYIWQGPGKDTTVTSANFENLLAGEYQVSVVDGNNCETKVGAITMPDPPRIGVAFTVLDSTSCFNGACDGRASAEAFYVDENGDAIPGNDLFNFKWLREGQANETTMQSEISTASQLCAGWNVLEINDTVCPTTKDSVNIPSPPAITTTEMVTNVRCNGESNGAIELNTSGGVAPYNFLWSIGETDPNISGLSVGSYNITITDDNGCVYTKGLEVREPNPLSFSTISVDPISCFGENDGRASVFMFGGTSPYTYNWSNGLTGQPIEDLAAGDYQLTVSDANNCMDSTTVTVTEPEPIMAIIPQPVPPQCFGDPTTLSIDSVWGGVGVMLSDYIYSVGNSGISFSADQPTTVFDGRNIVTIEDANGCTFSDTIMIQQPELVEVIFDPARVVVELGDSTVQLDPLIINSPDIPIDSFIWSPNNYLSSDRVQRPFVTPLRSQEYVLTVIDVNGCSAVNTVFVELDANRNVHIPNAFSPNGDGENDIFSLYACNGVSEILSARIFDRWGELIHESTGLSPNCEPGLGTEIWDGMFNGKTLNPGVYVYIVEVAFIDDITLTYRGSVVLMR